jgi:hypothetical protein
MKKIMIGSLVGGLILFTWSFLAWAILPLHVQTFMHTPAQDTLLQIMADNNFESRAYSMPMADNRQISSFSEDYRNEAEALMKASAGKPMATIYYLNSGYDMSGMTMLRGLLFNLLASLAICIMLVQSFSVTAGFFGRWWLTLVAGLFLNASGPLIQFNWMAMPWDFTIDMVADNFLNWGITGLWFAYYFKPGR